MKKSLALASFALVAVCAVFAPLPTSAQVVKQGAAYKMTLDLKKGAVYKFSIKTSITPPAGMGGGNGPQTFDTPVTMKVQDVKNGLATVQVTSTRPAMGSASSQPQSTTIKIDKTGKVTEGNEAGVIVSLPTKPVKIGESWKSSATSRAGMGFPMTINTTSTLKAVKAMGSRQVAVVDVVTSANGGGIKGSGSGTFTIDVKDGMLVNYDLKQNMTMTAPAPASTGGSSAKPGKPMTFTIPTTLKMARL